MNTHTTQSDLEGARPAALPRSHKSTFGAEQKSQSHHDYTVGWVCALPLEFGAATAMLDEEHNTLPLRPGDNNTYTLGRIGHHNVVLVCLPSYGTAKAATVACHLLRSFPNIQAGLMVGIGGGAPTSDVDIRLGDIVVGDLVVQYDLGKTGRGGKFERTGGSGKPPPDNLKMTVQSIRGRHNLQPSQISHILSKMLECHPSMRYKYARPAAFLDWLFEAAYDHAGEPSNWNGPPCGHCNPSQLVPRPARSDEDCKIHYGKIASGNQVIKHGKTRDRLAHELGAVCFEMEAAGLVDANFPCLVVRGISDYADSHKNNQWQGYAAAVAAAYAKELLALLPAATSKDASPIDISWQRFRCLPSASLGFGREVLLSIAKSEAKLRALISRDHGMTHSAMLKELRDIQLALDEALQFTLHNLPTDENSPCVTGSELCSDDVSQEPSLSKKLSPEKLETGLVGSEFPRMQGSDEIETAQIPLISAVETLKRLERIIQMHSKNMKAVSRSFRHNATRMALKIRRAERLFLRVQRPIQSKVKQEQRARLAHWATSEDSSMVTGLTHSLQQLNCGGAVEAEDTQSMPKKACKSKAETLLPSLIDPLFLLGNAVEGSSPLYSAEAMPTGSDEHHPSFQVENDMEGLATDYDPMDEDFDVSTVLDFVLEEDHTYTSFGSREYMLPNDDSWTFVEAALHHVIHELVLDKKALLGSAAAFEGRVLGVGTGIGLWAVGMADDNPLADVIGIDLSPIQPVWVPPNCRFIIDDFVLSYELIFACSDYHPEAVHCRNMAMAIYDWTKFVGWIKRELKPGGFVEFQELLWYPCIQDGGVVKPYTGPLSKFFQALARAFGAVEITLDAPRFLQTGLEQSGFKEVSQQDFLIPLGHWPEDRKSKNIGICFHEFLRDAIEPLSSRVLRRGLNYSPSEAKTWVARFKETLEESCQEMILFQFFVVHGRKSRPVP